LSTLKKVAPGKIITVFGCGGDRDKSKRPKMGKIAVENSTFTIITSDNPRTENAATIIREIENGVQGYSNYMIEEDRKKAIFEAISRAETGDLILIAGKGHEDYQIIGNTKIHFDDREIAAQALAQKP